MSRSPRAVEIHTCSCSRSALRRSSAAAAAAAASSRRAPSTCMRESTKAKHDQSASESSRTARMGQVTGAWAPRPHHSIPLREHLGVPRVYLLNLAPHRQDQRLRFL
eukprot:5074640-Pleurochrysis_carterae.AAC.1